MENAGLGVTLSHYRVALAKIGRIITDDERLSPDLRTELQMTHAHLEHYLSTLDAQEAV